MWSWSRSSMVLVVTISALVFATLSGQCRCQLGGDPPLQVGFYKDRCGGPDVEAYVFRVVRRSFLMNPSITAALLYLQFSDCFVNGCDASILLDGSNSEKTADQNSGLRDYETVINEAKFEADRVCQGYSVSCADIIVMAARDAVNLAGGARYEVETGRRDGTVSLASNVNLPTSSISISDSIEAFAQKGLNVTDMVYLLGGHTVGYAHCSKFVDRLYNFSNTGEADPTMDPLLLTTLRLACPQGGDSSRNRVPLDQNLLSSQIVDNSYYRQLLLNRGVLQIDQELAVDARTKPTVTALAVDNGFDFRTRFGQAMVKLGSVQVLTGAKGEIRITCTHTNE